MTGRLIVTNGDSAADRIRALLPDADVLPWRDVLHDGPVVDGPDGQAVRAQYLAEMSGGDADEIAEDMAARDARFRDAAAVGPVELWFEHDLYDQLQLAQIVALAADIAPPADLRLVQTDDHLTSLDNAAFAGLDAAARPMDAAACAYAVAVWKAFTGPDPRALAGFAADAESAPLPWLGLALRRLLAEYPDSRTGLSRSMALALQALGAEATTLGRLFARMQQAETAAFMGDLSFAWRIDALAQAKTPLLAGPDGARLARFRPDARDFFRQKAALTTFGGQVVAGARDHVAKNGIDQWIGGVRLHEGSLYRHDAASGRLLAPDGRPL